LKRLLWKVLLENQSKALLGWDIINILQETETGSPMEDILRFSMKVMDTPGILDFPKMIIWDPGWEGDTL
jgi:hypothetical protein